MPPSIPFKDWEHHAARNIALACVDWPVPLPAPEVILIDLRSADLRVAAPLPALSNRVVVVSLGEIEEGQHALTPDLGPLLVICERGIRSTLAARMLRADGLNAVAYGGGVSALLRDFSED